MRDFSVHIWTIQQCLLLLFLTCRPAICAGVPAVRWSHPNQSLPVPALPYSTIPSPLTSFSPCPHFAPSPSSNLTASPNGMHPKLACSSVHAATCHVQMHPQLQECCSSRVAWGWQLDPEPICKNRLSTDGHGIGTSPLCSFVG